MFAGRLGQTLDALRQFLAADRPVSEARLAVVARVFVAEPAVVHHEQFAAQVRQVGHHPVHAFLVDLEIDALPRVEQHVAKLGSVVEPVEARPSVDVAAHAALALVAEREGEYRGREDLAWLQRVLRLLLVDAREEVRGVGVVVVQGDAVVAGPGQRAADDAACQLPGASVERDHQRGVVALRVAHAVLVLEHLHAVGQRFFVEVAFRSPCAVEMRQPRVAPADGHVGRCEPVERHGFLLRVADLGPRLDHLAVVVGLVEERHEKRVVLVLHGDGGGFGAVPAVARHRLDSQFERHRTVAVRRLNGYFAVTLGAELRVGRIAERRSAGEDVVGRGDARSEILEQRGFAFFCRQQQRGIPGREEDVFRPEHAAGQQRSAGPCQYQKFLHCRVVV